MLPPRRRPPRPLLRLARGGRSQAEGCARPAAPAPVGNAVFPSAVNPKYASESAGKARMHTCVDQYKANKATNANGGLKWIQKGGGYLQRVQQEAEDRLSVLDFVSGLVRDRLGLLARAGRSTRPRME